MKKAVEKKLGLGKIKIASLSNAKQEVLKGGKAQKSGACVSAPLACLSQMAGGLCSADICRF